MPENSTLIIVVSILYMIVDAPEQADGIDNCGLCSWDEQRSVSYPSKDHIFNDALRSDRS